VSAGDWFFARARSSPEGLVEGGSPVSSIIDCSLLQV
jgi:hypothetical protein